MFSDLYRAAFKSFRDELTSDVYDAEGNVSRRAINLAEIASDPSRAAESFEKIYATDFRSESAATLFLERAYDVFCEFDELLASRYLILLKSFIEKYSLRYEIHQPCRVCPTLPGICASLVRRIKEICKTDPHLHELMDDFEETISDLRSGPTPNRIRSCMVKQVNLLEALASLHPDTSKQTIGAICSDLTTWPHASLCEAMKNLYKFTCDYPGIRHGGTRSNAVRAIDMRDMIGVSILLLGFVPYLTDQIDLSIVYRDPE
ncbi:hypothetical protein [Polystyrenella longa]|uniref:hypothetical protein n=1 Tax=Polystyrenella longa TaxID=2528007 RepID=UPI0011AA5E55|nr:hypothetical protein [Polystyrenella longa]